MKKNGIKLVGFFLILMLLFTLISRAVSGALIPEVKVEKVAEQVITHRPSSVGVVTYKKEIGTTVFSDLFVDTLEVTEGQKIEQNQLLYTLNAGKIAEKIEALETEIEKLKLQNEQAASEESAENEKKQRNITRATEVYNEAVASSNAAINQALQALEAAQKNMNNLDTTAENYEERKEQLESTLEEKQTAYTQAVEDKSKNVNDARRALEEASDPTSVSTVTSQTQKDIDEKQKEVDKLARLQQQKGEIRSDIAGMVTTISVKAGGVTTNEAPLLIADTTAGLRLNLQFSKDDQKYLVVGNEVILSRFSTTNTAAGKIQNQKIISVTKNEEDDTMLDVVIDLPKEELEIGESLNAEIDVPSTAHEQCVPVEALHLEESNNYYVYAVKTKETVLGTEKVIEKKDVEVVDKNNQYAAVTGIDAGQEVVTETDKAIEDGAKVKINE